MNEQRITDDRDFDAEELLSTLADNLACEHGLYDRTWSCRDEWSECLRGIVSSQGLTASESTYLAARLSDLCPAPKDEPEFLSHMRKLAADGWCVVLKVLPPGFPWLMEGSRSEYDAPCPDREVCPDKWCCQAEDVRRTGKWRRTQWAMHRDPIEALNHVIQACEEENKCKQN